MKKVNFSLSACALVFLLSSVSRGLPALDLGAERGNLHPSSAKRISFDETWSRYLTPDAIINTFRIQFSFARFGAVQGECNSIIEANRTLLGATDPMTGGPAIDRPNSSFVNWYTNCLVSYVKADDDGLSEQKIVKLGPNAHTVEYRDRKLEEYRWFFTPVVISECAEKDDRYGALRSPSGTVKRDLFICKWASLSREAKLALVKMLVAKFIGPDEVLRDLGLAASEGEFVDLILGEVEAFTAQPNGRYAFLNIPEEALSVRDAAKMIKFLISLEDTLKH